MPPFCKYWELIFKKKQMKVISWKDGSKVVHYEGLLKNLFSPDREELIKCTNEDTAANIGNTDMQYCSIGSKVPFQ